MAITTICILAFGVYLLQLLYCSLLSMRFSRRDGEASGPKAYKSFKLISFYHTTSKWFQRRPEKYRNFLVPQPFHIDWLVYIYLTATFQCFVLVESLMKYNIHFHCVFILFFTMITITPDRFLLLHLTLELIEKHLRDIIRISSWTSITTEYGSDYLPSRIQDETKISWHKRIVIAAYWLNCDAFLDYVFHIPRILLFYFGWVLLFC